MIRTYHKWYSPNLEREMEFLVFGHAGAPVLFFPTRTARFYDYEDWHVIDRIAHKIEQGWLQVYCVDSVDIESFYSKETHPSERIKRHIQYEKYILGELMPFMKGQNNNHFIISAGCSLGAYHAINIAFRHPHLFGKVVGMSGRYDLTIGAEKFPDLLDGFMDENIYFNMPTQFIANLHDATTLALLRKLEIVLAIGREDPFLPNNLLLCAELNHKKIDCHLHLWNGEAHRSKYWQAMVDWYL